MAEGGVVVLVLVQAAEQLAQAVAPEPEELALAGEPPEPGGHLRTNGTLA